MKGDWMRYTDVTYNGIKYRGIKFIQYRPYWTGDTPFSTHQSDNGYSTDTVYWFKFELVNWRVLDPSTGLVMCETIIDSQPYSNTFYHNGSASNVRYAYFNDASYTNYANDYETSSIRQWLNNIFYNTAFTDSEKKEISTTTLNNDGYYTSVGIIDYEELDSNKTSDKIFLLSFNEVRNNNLGFSSNYSDYDTARQSQGSDYAKSQGLWVNKGSSYDDNSNWFLRSPGVNSTHCCYVTYYGDLNSSYNVCKASYGVRPAFRFNRISEIGQFEHQHNYSSVVAAPSCIDKGYTTYTCECGDSYVADYVDILEHKDENGDYKCDYGCGYEFEKLAEPCSCNCHAGGIKAFFFKIINFFQKLFGINKVCACGVKH